MKINAYKMSELAKKEKVHYNTIRNKVKENKLIGIKSNVGKKIQTRRLDEENSNYILKAKQEEIQDMIDNGLI